MDDFLADLKALCRKHGAELKAGVYPNREPFIQVRCSGWQTEAELGQMTDGDTYTAAKQIDARGTHR